MASLSIHSRRGKVGGRAGDLWSFFLSIVGVCGESVDGQFVECLFWHGEALDAQGLEINLAVDDAPSQGFPAPPLDDVHTQRSDANCDNENGQDDD